MHQLMAEECGDAIGGDEELNDSDGQPLRRFPGQHRGVSAVIERKVWKIDGILNITKKMDLKDVLNIIRTEQEKEKKRRVSMPYSSDKEITDLHIQNRTRRLSELHEELFKLFSINAAVNQRKFEKQRMLTEANKQLVHEELLRKSMVKAINEAVEIERQERIKTLREMADGRHDSIFEVADTNAKLSKVHNELKRIFQYIEEDNRKNETKLSEEKERVKNRIRNSSKRKLSKELDEIKKRMLEDNKDLEATEKCRLIVKTKLTKVQDELLSIFDSYRNRAIRAADNTNTSGNKSNKCDDNQQNMGSGHMTEKYMAESNEARGILDEITLKKYDSKLLKID